MVEVFIQEITCVIRTEQNREEAEVNEVWDKHLSDDLLLVVPPHNFDEHPDPFLNEKFGITSLSQM